MSFDPDIATHFDRLAAQLRPPPSAPSPADLRALHREIAGKLGPGRAIGPIHDLRIDEIACRIYRPEADGPHPLLIYLHGGGWIGGDLDTHDNLCREIAAGTPCAVLAVDYRLAPEHTFPAGLEDCLAVIRRCLDDGDCLRVDPARIAVGGDSAGGNLAAAAVQCLRGREGRRPVFQFLAYPPTDLRLARLRRLRPVGGPGLTASDVATCVESYLGGPRGTSDPRCSPLLAPDLAGLPPAFVLTAEFDVIREQGEAYALALARAGVPTTLQRRAGMPHGFLSLPPDLPSVGCALSDVCRVLAEAFDNSPRPSPPRSPKA